MRAYKTKIFGTVPVDVTVDEGGNIVSVFSGLKRLNLGNVYFRQARGYMADFQETQSDNIRKVLKN